MYTYQDLKAKFPSCYSVGADVIARIGNENVVVAELGNGSFNLTKKGQELMGAAHEVKFTATVKAEVIKPTEPKTRAPRKPKAAPAEAPPVENDSLDDILAE